MSTQIVLPLEQVKERLAYQLAETCKLIETEPHALYPVDSDLTYQKRLNAYRALPWWKQLYTSEPRDYTAWNPYIPNPVFWEALPRKERLEALSKLCRFHFAETISLSVEDANLLFK